MYLVAIKFSVIKLSNETKLRIGKLPRIAFKVLGDSTTARASRTRIARDTASRKSVIHIIENAAHTVDERAGNYYSCMNAPANITSIRRPLPFIVLSVLKRSRKNLRKRK